MMFQILESSFTWTGNLQVLRISCCFLNFKTDLCIICTTLVLFTFFLHLLPILVVLVHRFSSCEDCLLVYRFFFSVFEKMLLKPLAVLPRASKQYQREIINTNILYVIFRNNLYYIICQVVLSFVVSTAV